MKQTSSHEFQPKRSSLLCLFNVVYITANTQFHKCRFFSQGPVGATGTGGFPGLRVSVICILVSQWRVRHYVILMHEIYSTRKLGFKNILTSLLFDKILSQFLYITEEKLSLWYFSDSVSRKLSSPLPPYLSSMRTWLCIVLPYHCFGFSCWERSQN